MFKCVASSRVEKCIWLWRPLNGDNEITVKREFPGTGNMGNNCSLELRPIGIEDQGYWACRVSVPASNLILTSSFVKIIVYNQGMNVFKKSFVFN